MSKSPDSSALVPKCWLLGPKCLSSRVRKATSSVVQLGPAGPVGVFSQTATGKFYNSAFSNTYHRVRVSAGSG